MARQPGCGVRESSNPQNVQSHALPPETSSDTGGIRKGELGPFIQSEWWFSRGTSFEKGATGRIIRTFFFEKTHENVIWKGLGSHQLYFFWKGLQFWGRSIALCFLDGWVGQAQELAAFWAGFFCVERLKININKPTYLSWGSTTSILMLNGVDPWINPIMLLDQSEDPKNPTILGICRDMTTAYISSYIYVSLT